ncbi:hypothetical protein BCR33DRAFT_724935 [Rhizoclosmatium globosum]|uniref:Uncharacterized protein n=1 Tax=Rhizoclosmatium globosum TaxID=329046 RepID=A0A1Y2B1R3_9FUNG|nr:hypothetical protein BCR33DRAFT_724935 [Rhizoclosmatium globosum]|eukprot:ORY28742.1 hypothetical protein BCR33DRAFT_724935 [Rhizoclosmatium globosum]
MQQLQGRVGGGGGEGWEVSAEERGALLAVAALMICAAVLFSTAVQQYFSVKQNRAIVGLEETLKELNSESVSGVLWTYEICCRRGFIKKRSDAIEIVSVHLNFLTTHVVL